MSFPICWIEFQSNNTQESQEFYGKLFDWKFQDTHMEGYSAYETGDGVGGGFCSKFPEGTPQHIIYIKVDDIEAKLAQVREAGGEVVREKHPVGENHGFVAHFKDPHGNLIGLWSAN